MFYGYCFPEPNDWHTPAFPLYSAHAAFAYCELHHTLFREIRITDTDDYTVIHVLDHMLMVARPDGTLERIALDNDPGRPEAHRKAQYAE